MLFTSFWYLPLVFFKLRPASLDFAAQGKGKHHHVNGLVAAIVAVIEKLSPVAGGARITRVKVGITGIQFNDVDARFADFIEIGPPDVGVKRNEVVAIRNKLRLCRSALASSSCL